MGNIPSKKETKDNDEVEEDSAVIDGGTLKPVGIYANSQQDFDNKILKKLILDRKIAPFYTGLEEVVNGGKSSKGKELMSDSYVECPICFLNYPKNINFSYCCTQPICTECFIQIKRSENSDLPAACPFCATSNFGVVYENPSADALLSDNDSSPTDAACCSPILCPGSPSQRRACRSEKKSLEVVTSDDIRPDYVRKLAEKRAQANCRQSLLSPRQRRALRLQNLGYPQRRVRRARGGDPFESGIMAEHLMLSGADIEEMMVMEAIRLSLLEPQPHSTPDGVGQSTNADALGYDADWSSNIQHSIRSSSLSSSSSLPSPTAQSSFDRQSMAEPPPGCADSRNAPPSLGPPDVKVAREADGECGGHPCETSARLTDAM